MLAHASLQPLNLLAKYGICLRCRWLREFRHLRYMWIPYTDTVVVVQINPIGSATPASLGASSGSRSAGGAQGASSVASSEGSGRGAGGREGAFTPEQRLQPLRGECGEWGVGCRCGAWGRVHA